MTRAEVVALARTKGIKVPPNLDVYNGNTYSDYMELMEENYTSPSTRPTEAYPDSFYRKHFPDWFKK